MTHQEIIFEKRTRITFKDFYKKNYNKVLWYIKTNTVIDEAIQEDIATEVFIRALESIESYDSSKAKLNTWLHSIIKNKIQAYFADRKNIKTLSINCLNDNDYETDTIINKISMIDECIVENVEKNNKILKLHNIILDKIKNIKNDNRHKEIVEMFYLSGFRYNEIVDYLEVDLSIVKNNLFKFRRDVMKEIDRDAVIMVLNG